MIMSTGSNISNSSSNILVVNICLDYFSVLFLAQRKGGCVVLGNFPLSIVCITFYCLFKGFSSLICLYRLLLYFTVDGHQSARLPVPPTNDIYIYIYIPFLLFVD